MEKDKIGRVLNIYNRLVNGELVNKTEMAGFYGVNERTIHRDINDIREYLEETCHQDGYINTVVYDRLNNGYHLKTIEYTKLTNNEILALCKILLDSRAFTKDEMQKLVDKLVSCCVPVKNQKVVSDLVSSEMFHYIELQHKSVFMDKLWDIGVAIRESRYIEIEYIKTGGTGTVCRKVKPVAIMFSEYYFYVTALIEDENVRKNFEVEEDPYPTIYRIDRIKKLEVLDEHFQIPYRDRFEEGEFRKRVQFMYGGKLQKLEFKYRGKSVEAVLDRLPTAQVVKEENGVYTIKAEVFGKGIEMWIRSQGDMISDVMFK